MGRWWLLLTALALWVAGGYALLSPGGGTRGHSVISPVRGLTRKTPGPEGKWDRVRSKGPARIVSMAPNLTETLFSLGLGEKVVGVTQDSDYPPAALNRPKVGTFWQPDVEAIIATRPDLVVTLAFEQQKDLARRLRRIGYQCLVVDIETVEDLRRAIAAVGTAAGAPGQARELLDGMESARQRLREAAAGRPKVKVLWVVQREPLRVAGRDTFIDEMIELAGGENAIGPTLHKYPPISAEQVFATRPEVIIEPAMVNDDLDGQRRQALSYWHRYANVPAVTGGRIYVLDGDLVSRLGPRLFAGIEMIARCLRPESAGE
jgi:iron complex transport system substrate-binding protein